MKKIKCSDCDYFATFGNDGAFCRMTDKRITVDNEKIRCKHYEVTDLRWKCDHHLPWVETSIGEINDPCIIGNEIKHCNVRMNHPERCPYFSSK